MSVDWDLVAILAVMGLFLVIYRIFVIDLGRLFRPSDNLAINEKSKGGASLAKSNVKRGKKYGTNNGNSVGYSHDLSEDYQEAGSLKNTTFGSGSNSDSYGGDSGGDSGGSSSCD